MSGEEYAIIKLIRKNGSDGEVTVYYETREIDESAMTATPWKDYEPTEGKVVFMDGEQEAEIKVKILKRDDVDQRDEVFGIVLKSVEPEGAKLSKKSM